MKNIQPKVYIIILNWNGWQDTLSALESVLSCDYPAFQVIIVDNASTDVSVKKIIEWANTVKNIDLLLLTEAEAVDSNNDTVTENFSKRNCLVLIKNNENYGYAGGNNVGIKYVLGRKDADYIWLLNNDTIIQSDALTKLVCFAESHVTIGAVGSKLKYFDRPEIIQALGGGRFHPWQGMVQQLGNNLFDSETLINTEHFKLDYITGASFLIKSAVVKDVGLLKEDYFMYSEDIDWSMRITQAGWDLGYCPASVVWHKEGGTAGFRSPLADYYSSRNNLYILQRFFRRYLPVAFCISLCGKILNRIRRRQFKNLLYVFQAYWDFLRGKEGKKDVDK